MAARPWGGGAEAQATLHQVATSHRLDRRWTRENSSCVVLSSRAPATPGSEVRWEARESEHYHSDERGRKRVARLDLPRARSVDYEGCTTERGLHEENISTEYPAPEEDARLPCAHEDPGRSEGVEAAPREGAQAPHCVAGAWGGEAAACYRCREASVFGRRTSRRSSGNAADERTRRASSPCGDRVRARGRLASRSVAASGARSNGIRRAADSERPIGKDVRPARLASMSFSWVDPPS